MTFLNSLFLFALPLLAVPLLLHFLRRREKKVYQWGAMRFLKEATTESRRMRLPESLLLLLARCLLVAGLIFALARPLINWGSSNAVLDRELIVIVDDSLSTARRVDGKQVFNRIRSAAEKVISDTPANLPFQILLASGGGRWIGEQPQTANSTQGKSSLSALGKTQPTSGSGRLMTCVRKAMSAANDRETSVRPRPAQRIVIVTDGLTPAWSGAEASTLTQLQSTIQQSKLPVKIQVVEVESTNSSFRNLSILQIKTNSDRVGVKTSVRLSAEVRNTGDVETRPCRIAWKIGDKTIGHSGVSALEPEQSTEVFWTHRFKKTGPVAIEAHLKQDSADDLPEDSFAKHSFDVVDRIPILIVDNQSQTGAADLQSQPITFLASALGYDSEGVERSDDASGKYQAIFAPTIVSADEIGSEDLSSFDAVIVVGTEDESPELSDLLMPEVRRGCGVWVMIGSDSNQALFNANWFQEGQGLSPLALVENPDELLSLDSTQLNADENRNKEIRIHPPSSQHPATRVLSDQQRIDLDQVTLQTHASFQPLILGDEVSVPLRSNQGQPLVIENSIGRGRVLVQSFPISLNATNWPVTNSFVVLVHEWLEYLAGPSARTMNLSTGVPLEWPYEDGNGRPVGLELPDGTKVDLTENAKDYGIEQSAGVFRYHSTRLPGTYVARTSINIETPLEIPFHISSPREELLAQPPSDDLRQQLMEVGQFDVAHSTDELSASARTFWSQQDKSTSTAGGQPVWHWIVLGLLGLLLLELLLAGRIGRRRGMTTESASQKLNHMQQLMKTDRFNPSGAGKIGAAQRKTTTKAT